MKLLPFFMGKFPFLLFLFASLIPLELVSANDGDDNEFAEFDRDQEDNDDDDVIVDDVPSSQFVDNDEPVENGKNV